MHAQNVVLKSAAWIAMILAVAAAGRAFAGPVQVNETYSRDPGRYAPGRFNRALVLETHRPLVYPVLANRKAVKEGTISAWFKPARQEVSAVPDALRFVSLTDGRQSITFFLASEPLEKSTFPPRRLQVEVISPAFQRNLWVQGNTLFPDTACAGFHQLVYSWNTNKALVCLDGKVVANITRGKEWLEPFNGANLAVEVMAPRVMWLDDIVILDRFVPATEATAWFGVDKPWRMDEHTSFYAGYDGALDAQGYLRNDGDLVRFACRISQPDATFRAEDPARFEFSLLNATKDEQKVALRGVIKDLQKQVVLDKTKTVRINGGDVKTIDFDMTAIRSNGLFWSCFTLEGDGRTLQTKTIPFARTLAVDISRYRAEDIVTGNCISEGFNPAVYDKWEMVRLYWRDIELLPEQYDFERVDASVRNVVETDRRPVAMLIWTPDWAVSRWPTNQYTWRYRAGSCPDNFDVWKRFLRKVGERYKGKVFDYEIWGEPYFNYKGAMSCWLDSTEQYAELVNTACDTLHAVDPAIRVGCNMGGRDEWRLTVARMTAGKADYYTIHPYEFVSGAGMIAKEDETAYIKTIRMLTEAKAKVKFNNTEFACYTLGGFGATPDGYPMTAKEFDEGGYWQKMPATVAWRRYTREIFVDLYTAAAMVVRGYTLCKAMECEYALWWSSSGKGGFSDLMYATHTPSPASVACANVSGLLAGYKFERRIDLGSPDWKAYLFRKDGDLRIVTWTDGREAAVFMELEGKHLKVLDLFGNDVAFERSGPVCRLDLRAVAPLYVTGIQKMPTISRPVLKTVCVNDYLTPGQPAELRVAVYNPLAEKIRGEVKVTLPPAFAALAPQPVALAPGEAKDLALPVKVPEMLTGPQAMETRFDTHTKALSTLTLAGSLPVRQCTIVRPVPTAVAIDGCLDEWGDWQVFPIRIDQPGQLVQGTPYTKQFVPRVDWKGTNDLSGYALLAYDASNLYFAVRVFDDSLDNLNYRNNPPRAYAGDCLEFFIDARGPKTQGSDTFTGAAYHLKIVPPMKDFPSVFHTISKPAEGHLPGMVLESVILSNGYTLEGKIPLAAFPDLAIKPGLAIGFDLALDDDDELTHTPTSKSQLRWAGAPGASANPSMFGIAVFGKPAP